MISKNSYEIKKDKIIYKPVAGLTIKNAINEGIEIAKIEKKPVDLYINDIIITLYDWSNPRKMLGRYYIQLNKKYELEKMKIQSKSR